MKLHVELEVSNWLFFFSNLRSVHFPLLFYSLLGKVQRQSYLFFSTGTYRLTNERMKPAIPQKTCNRLKDDKALTMIQVDKTLSRSESKNPVRDPCATNRTLRTSK